MPPEETEETEKAEEIVRILTARALKIVCAESCTAGLVAASLASVPGASAALWGSYVSYALDAKEQMLGVDATLLKTYGAVSGEAARSMAQGALENSPADLALSVTGLAGPDGDGSSAPVGAVWVGFCERGHPPAAQSRQFTGSRAEIRRAACRAALSYFLEKITD